MHKYGTFKIPLQKKWNGQINSMHFIGSILQSRILSIFCNFKLNLTAWLGCFLGETLHSNPLNNISSVEEINKMFFGLSTKSQHDRIWLSESCKIYLQHRDPLKPTKNNKQTKHYKPPCLIHPIITS